MPCACGGMSQTLFLFSQFLSHPCVTRMLSVVVSTTGLVAAVQIWTFMQRRADGAREERGGARMKRAVEHGRWAPQW